MGFVYRDYGDFNQDEIDFGEFVVAFNYCRRECHCNQALPAICCGGSVPVPLGVDSLACREFAKAEFGGVS